MKLDEETICFVALLTLIENNLFRGLGVADQSLERKISRQDVPEFLAEGLMKGAFMFSTDAVVGSLQKNWCFCFQVAFQPKLNVNERYFLITVTISLLNIFLIDLLQGKFGAYLYFKVDGSIWNI